MTAAFRALCCDWAQSQTLGSAMLAAPQVGEPRLPVTLLQITSSGGQPYNERSSL